MDESFVTSVLLGGKETFYNGEFGTAENDFVNCTPFFLSLC